MGKELSSYISFLENVVNPILEKYKKELNLDYLESNVTAIDDDVVIQVFIDYKFNITFDLIDKFTNLVNEELDKLDYEIGPYILDISSSSENRLIKIDELDYFINKYINVKTKTNNYIDLKLIKYDDKKLYCIFNNKGQLKNIEIDISSIEEIHISYKA